MQLCITGRFMSDVLVALIVFCFSSYPCDIKPAQNVTREPCLLKTSPLHTAPAPSSEYFRLQSACGCGSKPVYLVRPTWKVKLHGAGAPGLTHPM